MTNMVCEVASHFEVEGTPSGVEEIHAGLINSTWVVSCDSSDNRPRRYLLQKVNGSVFPEPQKVMENIAWVTEHIRKKLAQSSKAEKSLNLVATRDGEWWFFDESGDLWRCYEFIENCVCFESVETPQLAYEAGLAFGKFVRLLDDFPGERLHEVIADFHHTPSRYQALLKAAEKNASGRVDEVRDELERFAQYKTFYQSVTTALDSREVPVRVTHNDTKISNVLFDEASGKAVCVIDLDTVMPGSLLYDFGDLVRTTLGASEEVEFSEKELRFDLFEALSTGYLESAGEVISSAERELLSKSGALIALELGMRFLTDYLQGDVYFRVESKKQNLERARAQLMLGELMLASEEKFAKIIGDISRKLKQV